MVQRYGFTFDGNKPMGFDWTDEGDYVRYEDYRKLEAELEKLRQQVTAPADDGWIEWGGGECPVARGALVEIRCVDGSIDTEQARKFYWEHHGECYDIVAYRVVG